MPGRSGGQSWLALDIEDCAFGKDRLTVTLRRSKTDQDGQGRKVGIPYGSNPDNCPVRTIQAWIEQAGIPPARSSVRSTGMGCFQEGRLAPIDVARVVKKLAVRAGLDPAKYAGHCSEQDMPRAPRLLGRPSARS